MSNSHGQVLSIGTTAAGPGLTRRVGFGAAGPGPSVGISAHAVERYQQRVDPGASRLEAEVALKQFVAVGHRCARRRHWMHGMQAAPGTRFVFWAQRPGMCLVMRENVAVTVITRELCRHAPRRARHLSPVPDRVARWRWNGELDEAA